MDELLFTELSIIQETKKLLESFGDAEILYATAEFSPFSNQQRPDLQFIPKCSANVVFFIEYKFEPSYGFNDSYVKSILEHREFIQEDTDIEIKYAFATNAKIDKKLQQFLIKNGVTVFSSVMSANKLFDYVIEWANIKN